MSAIRRISPIAIGLFVISACAAVSWADGPTSQPAQTAAAPTSRPAAVSDMGVVRAALTQLYVIPRNTPTPQPGTARTAKKPSTQPAGPAAITIERNPIALAGGGKTSANKNPNPTATPDSEAVRPVTTVFIESMPWTQTGSHISQKEREWADYRYYGGTPSRYGVSPYARYDDGDYRYGFVEGYDYGRFNAETDSRVQALMSHASVQLDRGVDYFRNAQYQQAADTFQLAAETDQGDSISRIYAGHSLFALGRYRDAVRYLRRAFELQPRIAYLTYDIRGDYDNPALFEQQMNDLQNALSMAPRDTDRLFLLGYLHYYTGQRAAAFRYFMRAVEADKNDTISDRLMRNAQPPDVELDAYLKQHQQQK